MSGPWELDGDTLEGMANNCTTEIKTDGKSCLETGKHPSLF